MAPTSSPPPP
ncbi:hypothetical protein LINPERHAP1_LOCUS403 [Linum perenne]